MYKIANCSLRGSYSQGFRSPTLKEMYMNFDMANAMMIYGNPDLKSETSHNFSLSADIQEPLQFYRFGILQPCQWPDRPDFIPRHWRKMGTAIYQYRESRHRRCRYQRLRQISLWSGNTCFLRIPPRVYARRTNEILQYPPTFSDRTYRIRQIMG